MTETEARVIDDLIGLIGEWFAGDIPPQIALDRRFVAAVELTQGTAER